MQERKLPTKSHSFP